MTEADRHDIELMIDTWKVLGKKLFGFDEYEIDRFIKLARPFEDDGIILHETPQYWLLAILMPDCGEFRKPEKERSVFLGHIDHAIDTEILRNDYFDPKFDWSDAVARIETQLPEFGRLVRILSVPE